MSVANKSTFDGDSNCRRSKSTDRRKSHFKAALFSFFNSRRLEIRRDGNSALANLRESAQSHSYVIMMGVLIFLIFDAILSYSILSIGLNDASTLVQVMTESKWQLFVVVKSLVSALSILFLATYNNIASLEKLTMTQVIVFFMSVYILLLSYEIALII